MSDTKDKTLEAHLFICTNLKERGESCAPRGGIELRDKMKARGRELWPGAKIRVNAAGCLGHCKEGIAAVLYPEGKWMTGLTPESLPELEAAVNDALKKKS